MPVGRMLAALAILATHAAATAAAPPDAAVDAPSLQERLDRLVERLEQRRQEHHIPGLAIAVVKDDAVVLSRGLGLADVDGNVLATDETLFAVGSTTKAFTATLIGMLVDDGAMSWDEPVRTHLPQFHLADPGADEQVAIRDLLCHRTGLATMTLLWYGTRATREEILAAAGRAELLNPFRAKFNYSNVSYLAAGMAAGRAAGSSWSDLLEQRLLRPLGMDGSSTSLGAMRGNPRAATGYRWDKEESELIHQPMRDLDTIAPAGAINSSARDMARWVRFQLGRGALGDRRLLSETQHAETWSRQIEIGDGVGYGLGWFLREWRGGREVDHAGGIDGFTAEVALLPDQGVGFVLLMNQIGAPLQEESREIVFDSLLGTWSADEKPPPDEDFRRFTGTYIANFGPFHDADFVVLVRNGRLAVDVPGQMVYELQPPDADGKRAFVITDRIAVRFDTDEDGAAARSLTMFQAGLELEAPRRGVEPPLEIDLDAARAYLGKYHSDDLGVDVGVLLRGNRLAVDVPGQMTYELHAPDAEGRWVFRVKASIWVEFNRDDTGAVTSLTMTQDGMPMEMARVAGAGEGDALPTADEVMAIVHAALGAEHAASLRSLRITGRVRLLNMGVDGTITTLAARGDRLRDEADFGPFGRISSVLNGDRGWVDYAFEPNVEISGEQLEQMKQLNPLLWLGDWHDAFARINVAEKTDFEGEPVYAVVLKPEVGQPTRLLVHAETGRPVARIVPQLNHLGMRIEITYRFSDYRPVEGVLLPYRIEMANAVSGRMIIEKERVETNVETDAEAFTLGGAP